MAKNRNRKRMRQPELPSSALERKQLELLQLQCQAEALDLADKRRAWFRRPATVLPWSISVILAIGTVGGLWFQHNTFEARAALAKAEVKEADVKTWHARRELDELLVQKDGLLREKSALLAEKERLLAAKNEVGSELGSMQTQLDQRKDELSTINAKLAIVTASASRIRHQIQGDPLLLMPLPF